MTLQRPHEIQGYYRDPQVVAQYLERRTGQPLNGTLHRAQVRSLRALITARAPRVAVEMAPGPARLTAELPLPGVGLAIEYSEGMLEAARMRLPEYAGWRLVRGDAFHLPLPEASVDLLFTLRFVRRFHIAERRLLYAEIRRVLRPGATLVLDAQNRTVALPHRQERGLERYPVYDELYDRAGLVAELEEAGFRVRRLQGMIRHAPIQRRLNRLRRYRLAPLARLLIEAVDRIPGDQPSTWLVECERS